MLGGPPTVGELSEVLIVPPTGVKAPGVLGTHSLFITGVLPDSVTPAMGVCGRGRLFVAWWQ